MSDNVNFYKPQISPELVEQVKVYRDKNRPLESVISKDKKLWKHCYRDGIVIIETVESKNIIDYYNMPDDELQKMITRYDKAAKILKEVADSARKLRSTGIK